MAINRYSNPAIAQFNPLSYEEIMAIPMAQYQEYGRMLEEMGTYDPQTSKVLPTAEEYLKQGQSKFEQEFTAARESLEKYGAFASKGTMINLRKSYQEYKQKYLLPVEQHYADVKENMKEVSKVKGYSGSAINKMQSDIYSSSPIDPKTGEFVGHGYKSFQDGISLREQMDLLSKNLNVSVTELPPTYVNVQGGDAVNALDLIRTGTISPDSPLYYKTLDKFSSFLLGDPIIKEYLAISDMYEGTRFLNPKTGEADIFVSSDDPVGAIGQNPETGQYYHWNKENDLADQMRTYIEGFVYSKENYNYRADNLGGGKQSPRPMTEKDAAFNTGMYATNITGSSAHLTSLFGRIYRNSPKKIAKDYETRYATSLQSIGAKDLKGNYVIGEAAIPKGHMLDFVNVMQEYQSDGNDPMTIPSKGYFQQKGVEMSLVNDMVNAYSLDPEAWNNALDSHNNYLLYTKTSRLYDGMAQESLAALSDEEVKKAVVKYFPKQDPLKRYADGVKITSPADIKGIPFEYDIYNNRTALLDMLSDPDGFKERALKSFQSSNDPNMRANYAAYASYITQTVGFVDNITTALGEMNVLQAGEDADQLKKITGTYRLYNIADADKQISGKTTPFHAAFTALHRNMTDAIQNMNDLEIITNEIGDEGGRVTLFNAFGKDAVEQMRLNPEKISYGVVIGDTDYNLAVSYGGKTVEVPLESLDEITRDAASTMINQAIDSMPESDFLKHSTERIRYLSLKPELKELYNYLDMNFIMYQNSSNAYISPVMQDGESWEDAYGNTIAAEFSEVGGNRAVTLKFITEDGTSLPFVGNDVKTAFTKMIMDSRYQAATKSNKVLK